MSHSFGISISQHLNIIQPCLHLRRVTRGTLTVSSLNFLTLPNTEERKRAELNKTTEVEIGPINFISLFYAEQGLSPQIWLLYRDACLHAWTRVAAGSVPSCFLGTGTKLPIPSTNWRLNWMGSYPWGTLLGFRPKRAFPLWVLILLKSSSSTLPQEGHLKLSMLFSSVPHIFF